MGSLTSRQEGATEEPDPDHVHSYRYPPKSGNYFGTHFIMGGEKFETPQPEAYLFGENSDLNFLSGRPAPCPYALSAPSEPSKTLKSVINVRKDSLRLVRHQPEVAAAKDTANQRFNIEFTFDSDVRCTITIHYFCTEEVTRTGLTYRPRDPSMSSATYRYKCGAAQTFSHSDHVLEPALYEEAELTYNADVDVYPVVVLCRSEEGDEPRQCHVITAYVDRLADGSFVLKPLKQKQFLDGLMFLLQEIYGIENKLVDKLADDEMDDSGAECVICMSDLRDTLILPCRHLCVCNCCADHLRYQANNCPICRAPFRALLQLRAVQKSLPGSQPPTEGMEGVPAGYEPVALVEALNGPLATTRDSASDRSPLPSRAASAPPRPPTSNKRDDQSGGSDRSGSRDSLPAVSSAVVPLEVRRRVLAERGRAELEAVDVGAAHRSRTPSREKSTPEDGGADDTDECERRSLLESPPPPPPPAPADPLSPAHGPAASEPAPATCGRLPCDAGCGDCDDDSVERNSRLVTVIPIEHDSQTWANSAVDPHPPRMDNTRDVQLEEYEDTEDEVIEAQCRPDTERTPPNLKSVSARSTNRKVTSGRPQAAEVVVLTSESPGATSRASLSSSGSTRLLISGISRETEM